MSLTQESILSFLLERGGKAKNSELLNSFRSLINGSDAAEKQHNRDLFKKLVNSVAVVKQIDEVKFVVVKKRYQDFVKEHDASTQKAQMDDDDDDDGGGGGGGDSVSSQNASFSYTSPRRAESAARMIYADLENNNLCYASMRNGNRYSDGKHVPAESVQKRKMLSRSFSSADTTTVKVLNISGDQASRAGRSGAVFAVIAVKSPPREQLHRSHPQVRQTSDKPITVVGTKVSPRSPLSSNFCKKEASGESQCWTSRQTESIQPPQVKPTNRTTKPADDARYCESVPLEPSAHEWLVKCAAGLWGQVYALLLRDTRLAQKKDFMSGFTALHWAAKDGNGQMIHKLMDVSRKRGTGVDVNSKAHGGYTPLHIAAIHGHTEVMMLLVQSYGASVSERDNSGKKAFHYLGEGASAEVRTLLGGGGGGGGEQQRKKTGDEENKEQVKGFNTISKLFQPHMGKKQKKYAQDW